MLPLAAASDVCEQYIQPRSLQWQSSAQDRFGLRTICPFRLVESSTRTATLLELHVQSLETYNLAFERKSLDVGTADSCFIDPVVYSYIRCMVRGLLYLRSIPTLRRLTGLFVHIFTKSSDDCCSPIRKLLFHTYGFPLCHVSVICRRVALSLVRNQYLRHDYIVRVAALSAFSSAVSLHPSLQRVCTYGNVYRVVSEFVLLNLTHISLGLYALFNSALDFFCMPLHCCDAPSVTAPRSHCCDRDHVTVPAGGGRPYLFPKTAVGSLVSQCAGWLTPDHVFRYVDHVDDVGRLAYPSEQGFVHVNLPLTSVIPHVSKKIVQKIAQIHKVPLSLHWNLTKDELIQVFEGHSCINCSLYISVLETQLSPSLRKKKKCSGGICKSD